jgi:hypothetical protein
MKEEPVKTKIRDGGLRYESKTTGTDFPGAFGHTMSCVNCGKHMPRSRLESVMLAGKRQFRCRGTC